MTDKHYLPLACFITQTFLFSCAFAQQPENQSASLDETNVSLKKQVESRSGYKADDIGYGGRSSVGKQLYLDNLFVPDHLRFPEFDKSIQPYYEWKRKIREQYNLQFGQDYTSLFQKASDSLTGTDSASAGVYRLYGRWLAIGKDKKNAGALVFKIENSHKYGTVAPDNLNKELGYIGSTGLLYSDLGWVLNDLNWQQRFNENKGGFVIGRADPNDYMDVVDYANPWTTFQNQNILENRSIAIPDTGFTAGIGYAFDDQWYLKLAVHDANGSLDDPGFFEQGAEFFSFAEVGWTPSLAERDLRDMHVTIWHVDKRVNENVPEGEGVAFGASWLLEQEWIIFGRTGQSRGGASLMRRSTTIGFSHIWKSYLDVIGWAVNYSEPVNEQLRDQTTMETFLRIQLTQNIAITPSFQLLINPALNPQQDHIQIYGLRFRMTL
jgi:porin